MQDFINHFHGVGLDFIENVLAAIAILVVGRYLIMFVCRGVASLLRRSSLEETLHLFVERMVYFALFTFLIISVLHRLGIETTSFIAVLGATAFAVGLAFQGTLSNLAAGVMIIVFRPFNIGEYVEIGGHEGTVRTIDVFSTGITGPNNKWIHIPNAKIVADTITNVSRMPTRRIDMTISIGYGDDIRKAKNILLELLAGNAMVLPDPAPVIGVMNLGDNGIDLVVRPWVKTENYWAVRFWFLEAAKETLTAEGITIPYPVREVRIINNPADTKKS